jgi:hypothetical protein
MAAASASQGDDGKKQANLNVSHEDTRLLRPAQPSAFVQERRRSRSRGITERPRGES